MAKNAEELLAENTALLEENKTLKQRIAELERESQEWKRMYYREADRASLPDGYIVDGSGVHSPGRYGL